MATTDLDNPFYASLRAYHRKLALGGDGVARYPAEYAPFLGVAQADAEVDAELGCLVAAGETVLLVGVAPRVGPVWRLELLETLPQLVRTAPVPVPSGPEITLLGRRHRADVLALTTLVYPHYFRTRTVGLGRYFGIYVGGRLAAMIGERAHTATHTELSAICTHPDFVGRGFASRLIAFLGNETLARGSTPFLHVSRENVRALALYERLGYRIRAELGFWSLRRAADGR